MALGLVERGQSYNCTHHICQRMLPSNKGDVISRKGKLTSYISTMIVYQRQFQSIEFVLLNHKIACLQRNLILANK